MPLPSMTPVESSNLEAIGFDGEAIAVRFHNGRTYRYTADPDEADIAKVFDAFASADSKGRYFAQHIRGQLRGERVDAE